VVCNSSHFHYLCIVLNLFCGIAGVSYLHSHHKCFTMSLHHNAFYITANKLCLNKLSYVNTHACGIKLPSPSRVASIWLAHLTVELCTSNVELWVASSMPEFLPSASQLKWQVSFHMPALPYASFCRSQNSQDRLLGPPVQSFGHHDGRVTETK
jgi:hypothetical protein